MDRSKVQEQLLIFVGSFIFFLCTLATNFSGPHDSIGYLNGIVVGKELSHPHHILYHFTAHYWLVFAQSLLPNVKDYYLLEVFTALSGSGSLVFIYSFFRNRFSLSWKAALVNTSVIAFSYGMWFYSVNIEVYATPMLFLLACLYVLTKPDLTRKDILIAAVLHSLAIMFHQLHALFTPVLLYVIWRQRATIKFIPAALQYALTGIVLVGGAYFIMGWMVAGRNSFETWFEWMRGYTGKTLYWQPLGLKTPGRVITGFSHAFVGGHFVFRIPGLSDYMEKSFAAHSLHDELFLARHISGRMAVFLTVLTAGMGIVLLGLVLRFIRKFRAIKTQYGNVVLPMLVAGGLYSAFFLVWMPEILEFWIFQMVLLWMVLLGTLPVTGFPFRLKPFIGTLFLSISLFLINYLGSVRWLQHIEYDWYYTKVEPIRQVATSKDVILLQEGWILKDFLEYFTKSKVQNSPSEDSLRAPLDKTITDCLSNGGKVYVYPERNSEYASPDPAYIDSLLIRQSGNYRVLHQADPTIIVIGEK